MRTADARELLEQQFRSLIFQAADEMLIDPLSGNAVLNGIPVELVPVEAAVPA